jgi:hypothetical protein
VYFIRKISILDQKIREIWLGPQFGKKTFKQKEREVPN